MHLARNAELFSSSNLSISFLEFAWAVGGFSVLGWLAWMLLKHFLGCHVLPLPPTSASARMGSSKVDAKFGAVPTRRGRHRTAERTAGANSSRRPTKHLEPGGQNRSVTPTPLYPRHTVTVCLCKINAQGFLGGRSILTTGSLASFISTKGVLFWRQSGHSQQR